MGISFGSIGTGLPKDIVKQIIEAERVPIKQMQERKGKVEEKKALLMGLIKLVENMRGDILANKNARSLRELEVKTSSDAISVTADKNLANPGNHKLEVLELAEKSSAISNGIEDKDNTYLGVGYISAVLPNGDTKEIYVDQDHATLTGIAQLINGDDELGMKANVVNDGKDEDEPWRLILSIDGTGDGNRAEFPYLYLVDGEVDLYLDQERPAQDAKIKLDGFELETDSNTVTDLIPGLTINLNKAKPGDEISIEVTEDVEKIGGKVKSLIDNINNVLKFIKQQNSLDQSSDTSRTLGGDLSLQQIESRIRTAIFTPVKTDSGAKRLSDFGIAFTRDGVLSMDQAKFKAKLDEDYKAIAQTLTGVYGDEGKTKGIIDYLDDTAKSLLSRPSGVLQTRKSGIQSKIDQIDRQITNRERLLGRKEEILKQKFARLEETIARIKGQGSGLAGLQQGQGVNPITQLG